VKSNGVVFLVDFDDPSVGVIVVVVGLSVVFDVQASNFRAELRHRWKYGDGVF
jgi:hypothetical protein